MLVVVISEWQNCGILNLILFLKKNNYLFSLTLYITVFYTVIFKDQKNNYLSQRMIFNVVIACEYTYANTLLTKSVQN